MTPHSEPFWEAAYRDDEADVWGPPSQLVVDIVDRIPACSWVLDVGCGDGRNALFLAEHGFVVRAFDCSAAAIEKLKRRAQQRSLVVEAWVGDLAAFSFDRSYGLVVAEGVLQFVDADLGDRFLAVAREHTLPGGANVISVFTDAIAPPSDLAPFIRRLFRQGQLRSEYAAWEITVSRSTVMEDEHPGGLRHRHAIDDLVAVKNT